jgi:DNA-binding NtrC family response regulator
MTRLTTEMVEGPNARLEIDAAEIKIVAGPDRGEKMTLGTTPIVLGSAPECTMVLHDPTVSGRHAEIVCGSRGFSIRDLGSTNGILLGSHEVERAPLVDGMKFRLGETTIAVHTLGHRTSLPMARRGHLGRVVAHSAKMRILVADIEKVAGSELTVLLLGESGAGKEEVAQALHLSSARARGPFVVFDCGAASPSLVTAELFGHERGAFTGADIARPGLFEEAEGGTLFIDEVGELPIELQRMLLGALERKTGRRVGGTADLHYDVRIVAATNRNLGEEARAKRFREDLFFRLSACVLRVPPLRERPEDIPMLADLFAKEAGVTLSSEALSGLAAYHWPGNVRELRNAVTRFAVAPDQPLLPAAPSPAGDPDLFDQHGGIRKLHDARQLSADAFERRYLTALLELAQDDMGKAIELAGVTRQLIQRLLVEHGFRDRRR